MAETLGVVSELNGIDEAPLEVGSRALTAAAIEFVPVVAEVGKVDVVTLGNDGWRPDKGTTQIND